MRIHGSAVQQPVHDGQHPKLLEAVLIFVKFQNSFLRTFRAWTGIRRIRRPTARVRDDRFRALLQPVEIAAAKHR